MEARLFSLNQSALRDVHAGYGIVTEAYCPLGTGTLLANPAVTAVAGAHGKSAAQVLRSRDFGARMRAQPVFFLRRRSKALMATNVLPVGAAK